GIQGQNVNGFYVMGPGSYSPGFPGVGPTFETLRVKESGAGPTTNSMTYILPAPLSRAEMDNLPLYGLFLQRLACPQLPPNPPAGSASNTRPDPAMPYNPYITVDYVEFVWPNDAAKFSRDESGGHKSALPVWSRFSSGRNQPFAANNDQQRYQIPKPPL